jgi:Domain of unknown function (DUF397)
VKWINSSYSIGNGACVEVAWRKAKASGIENCVEVGTMSKSSYSVNNGACVETGTCVCGDDVLVRDTKDREGPVLRFTHAEWGAFIDGCKKGEFDDL